MRKTTDAGPSSPDIQLRYLFGHFYMLGKDTGTMMHLKKLVIVTFIFKVVHVCYIAQRCGCFTVLIFIQFENIFQNECSKS